MPKCERCYKDAKISTMSRLNQQTICMDCAEKEKSHPRYEEAREAERQAVLAGDYNFEMDYL